MADGDQKPEIKTEGEQKPQKMIRIRTEDGEIFQVEEQAAKQSKVIKDLLEMSLESGSGDKDDDILPLPKIRKEIFRKVHHWMDYHAKHDGEPKELTEEEEILARFCEEIPEWDQKYLQVDQSSLFEIMLAADYLDIKKLRGLCCKTVANILKGKTVEQIREMYGIENDFTPEEEEEIRKQTAWCENEAS
ncbi:hypothetical protein RvY_17765 [Ramazzottius varieornatus]|uniref:Skp1-related protein n=1 Tax=Ramazzottius varieornatus TaxID=947166 RepID=A0A1D1W9Z5_RAMVA|nr:hypothetical protein RvY_17765 [Ramazzottius varieornatus]